LISVISERDSWWGGNTYIYVDDTGLIVNLSYYPVILLIRSYHRNVLCVLKCDRSQLLWLSMVVIWLFSRGQIQRLDPVREKLIQVLLLYLSNNYTFSAGIRRNR